MKLLKTLEMIGSFCEKLEIKDLSNIDEQVLTFILIPYGSEKVFKNLNS